VPASRPRVGLIVEELSEVGGLKLAADRHARLVADQLDVIPIALSDSEDPRHCHGLAEVREVDGRHGYRVRSSGLRSDALFDYHHMQHFGFAQQIVRITRRERLDALHVFGCFKLRPLLGAYAAVICDLPLILSFRGVDLDARIFGPEQGYVRTAVAAARVCVCMNRSAKRLLAGLFAPSAPIFVSPNHFEPEAFDHTPPATLPVNGPVIGCLGDLRRIMGLDFLLAAFDRLASQRGDLWLALFGALRPLEAHYYAPLLEHQRHSERVLRFGPIEHRQVLSYLAACDVLAFPSISDASPNKVLEAMAAGRAIVASDVGGIPELIRDGVDGVLVDGRDAGALATAIGALLEDPQRRRRLGESAAQRVCEQLDAEHARVATLEYYRAAGLDVAAC